MAPFQTVRLLHKTISQHDILWAITGSMGMVLQGMERPVHDIDLQTDAAGAYKIERLFNQYIVIPVSWRESAQIRSHFGVLEIAGIQVEIMGAIEKRQPDGAWEPAPILETIRQWVTFANMRLPVLSLAYETKAYRKLGRLEKAKQIETYLQSIHNPC